LKIDFPQQQHSSSRMRLNIDTHFTAAFITAATAAAAVSIFNAVNRKKTLEIESSATRV
jgi:hypothetical protein